MNQDQINVIKQHKLANKMKTTIEYKQTGQRYQSSINNDSNQYQLNDYDDKHTHHIPQTQSNNTQEDQLLHFEEEDEEIQDDSYNNESIIQQNNQSKQNYNQYHDRNIINERQSNSAFNNNIQQNIGKRRYEIQNQQDKMQNQIKNNNQYKHQQMIVGEQGSINPFILQNKQKTFNIFTDQKIMNQQLLIDNTNNDNINIYNCDNQQNKGKDIIIIQQSDNHIQQKKIEEYQNRNKTDYQNNKNISSNNTIKTIRNKQFQNKQKIQDIQNSYKDLVSQSNASTVYSIQNNSDQYSKDYLYTQQSTPIEYKIKNINIQQNNNHSQSQLHQENQNHLIQNQDNDNDIDDDDENIDNEVQYFPKIEICEYQPSKEELQYQIDNISVLPFSPSFNKNNSYSQRNNEQKQEQNQNSQLHQQHDISQNLNNKEQIKINDNNSFEQQNYLINLNINEEDCTSELINQQQGDMSNSKQENIIQNKTKVQKNNHLLDKVHLFKNSDSDNSQIVSSGDLCSNETLSQSQQQQPNITNQSQRKSFCNIKKRPSRQNIFQRTQSPQVIKQSDQNNFIQQQIIQNIDEKSKYYNLQNKNEQNDLEFQNNVQKIQQQQQQQSNNNQNQQVQKNIETSSLISKYNLSGNKNQLEQIKKIQIQDVTINENSFSDDSPQPYTSDDAQKQQYSLHSLNQNHRLQENNKRNNQFYEKNQTYKKTTFQQFQTQIMNDSNQSQSECSVSNETVQGTQILNNNNQSRDSLKIQKRNRESSIENYCPIAINNIIKEIYENDSNQNSPFNKDDTQPNKPKQYYQQNNLLVFSADQIQNQIVSSNQQIDDFNNCLIPNSKFLLSFNEEPSEFQQQDNGLNSNQTKAVNQTSQYEQERNNKSLDQIEFTQKYESPKINIISFDNDQEQTKQELVEEQIKQEYQEEFPLSQFENQKNEIKNKDLDIVQQYQGLTFFQKQRRANKQKVLSQNNTPLNSKDQLTSYLDEKRMNQFTRSIPSKFSEKINSFEISTQNEQILEDNNNQIKQDTQKNEIQNLIGQMPMIHLCSQNKYDLTKDNQDFSELNEAQIDIHQEKEIKEEDDKFQDKQDGLTNYCLKYLDYENRSKKEDQNNEEDNEKELEDEIDDNENEDEEDDEDEDEDDDELELNCFDEDQDDENQEGEMSILKSISCSKSTIANFHFCDHSNNPGTPYANEQVKYNQREIGIGKYFYEKYFNLYGDNKLFQKKEKKLKKWRKMIKIAQDRLQQKYKNTENSDFQMKNNVPSIYQNSIKQSPPTSYNNVLSPDNTNLQSLNIQNEQQQYQEIPEITKQQSNIANDGSALRQDRFKIYQQKPINKNMLFPEKYLGNQEEEGNNQNQKITNDEPLSIEEEYQLIYYFKIINKKQFLKSLRKGPPMWYRWSAWKAAVDLNLDEYRSIYDKLKYDIKTGNNKNNETNPIDKQINKDISRTFPCEPFFSDPKYESQSLESLRIVLKALSIYFDNVGYCQGMNFFVAYLLLVNGGDELSTFGMIIQMDIQFNIMSLFEEDFPLLQFLNFVFFRELGKKFQKLQKHFSLLKIPETMWVVQWFQTLFLNSLCLNVVCRLWDYILFSGNILSVVSISLSLIHEFNTHLLKMNIDDFSNFTQKLKSCSVVKGEMRNSPFKPRKLLSPFIHLLQKETFDLDEDIVIDPEKIIKRAKQYEINKKDSLSYIAEFKKINFLFKDKPFLTKLENQLNNPINTHNNGMSNTSVNTPPHLYKKSHSPELIQSHQNSPQKNNKDFKLQDNQQFSQINNQVKQHQIPKQSHFKMNENQNIY